jgi:hypothetical protein
MSNAGPEQADPGLLTSSVTVIRLLVGWSGTAVGILNLSMGADSVSYLVFHALLLITGVLLLGFDRLVGDRRPDRTAYLAGGGVTLLGLVLSAVPATTGCCMRDLAERHGFPFALLGRDPGTWQFSAGHTVADLVFWACFGAIVLVLVTRLRPARDVPPREPAARERAAEDENVGGLP